MNPQRVREAEIRAGTGASNGPLRARGKGKEFEILVECTSKRSEEQLSGRTSQNKMVVFDRGDHKVGDYVRVRITGCSSATLFGEEIK